jgi:hypothetical protein
MHDNIMGALYAIGDGQCELITTLSNISFCSASGVAE